jgi:hypothetical protein
VLAALPGPADPVQGNLVEVDKKPHERTPEEHTQQELLGANPGVYDSGPDSKTQRYSDGDTYWRDHVSVYHT